MEADQSLPAPVRFQPPVTGTPSTLAKECCGRVPLALYLHVPFCLSRCYFCDFVTVVGSRVTPEAMETYTEALHAELRRYARHEVFGGAEMVTGQLGGGTPTMLDPAQLGGLLDAILDFVGGPAGDIVVEGFPTSVTPEKLALLAATGVKFNMGVQTFDSDVLVAIGRRHEGEDALRALDQARTAGLGSVGVDLIYGLPDSTERTVERDVRTALREGVDHVALYPLWVYPGTSLDCLVRAGRREEPGLDSRRRQLTAAHAVLAGAGFERYTAFHYARSPEHRHRYGLWQMEGRDWLGAGQGAVSQLDGVIYENDRTIGGYVAKAAAGQECATSAQVLAVGERMVRHVSYGIRLATYPDALFAAEFGRGVTDVFGPELRLLEEEGLIVRSHEGSSLTVEGILRLGDIENRLAATPAAEPAKTAVTP